MYGAKYFIPYPYKKMLFSFENSIFLFIKLHLVTVAMTVEHTRHIHREPAVIFAEAYRTKQPCVTRIGGGNAAVNAAEVNKIHRLSAEDKHSLKVLALANVA